MAELARVHGNDGAASLVVGMGLAEGLERLAQTLDLRVGSMSPPSSRSLFEAAPGT